MFLEFTQGTFIWQWFHSWAGLNAMTITMIVAVLVVGLTRFTAVSTAIKAVVAGAMVATLPLGLAKMGIDVGVYNDPFTAYLSFFGAIVAVGVGVPYLFHQILRSSAGKESTYTGITGRFTRPVPVAETTVTGGFTAQTMDSTNNNETNSDSPVHNTLDFRTGPMTGQTMDVGLKTFTVGRSPDNDIVINDPTVSRNHARITFDGTQFQIEDLNSTSGTKVNGKSVIKEAVMAGGTIKLGNTEIGFNNKGDYQEKFPAPGVPAARLRYSYDGGETWAETDPLYVSPLRDCAYANLLELRPGEYIAVYYTAAMGTEYLVPQDYGRDLEELERESPELLKYTDADNEIELVRFREC